MKKFKRWDEFSNEQMQFIKENYEEKVNETIHNEIDNALIYDADIKILIFQYTTTTDLLNGNFTMNDLYENMFNDCYFENFADIAEIIYNDLTEEEQNEIDEIY